MGKIGENPIWLPEILFFPIFQFCFSMAMKKEENIIFRQKKKNTPKKKQKNKKTM